MTFPDILQKGKLIILLEAIILRSNPFEIPKKCKIKAPCVLYSEHESLCSDAYLYSFAKTTVIDQGTSSARVVKVLTNWITKYCEDWKMMFTQSEWFYSLKVLAHFRSKKLVNFSTYKYNTQISSSLVWCHSKTRITK